MFTDGRTDGQTTDGRQAGITFRPGNKKGSFLEPNSPMKSKVSSYFEPRKTGPSARLFLRSLPGVS